MWGIVILIIFSIGLASILIWVGKALAKAYHKHFTHQAANHGQQVSFVGKTLPQAMTVADAPGASSSNKCFFIPRYRDVIVPDKHNIATVVEFENPLTQWIYDVMAGIKRFGMDIDRLGRISLWLCLVFFGIVPALIGFFTPLIGITALASLFIFVIGPIGSRAARSGAKSFKNMTPDDWCQVYHDVQASNNRSEEIAEGIRCSGVLRPSRW